MIGLNCLVEHIVFDQKLNVYFLIEATEISLLFSLLGIRIFLFNRPCSENN